MVTQRVYARPLGSMQSFPFLDVELRPSPRQSNQASCAAVRAQSNQRCALPSREVSPHWLSTVRSRCRTIFHSNRPRKLTIAATIAATIGGAAYRGTQASRRPRHAKTVKRLARSRALSLNLKSTTHREPRDGVDSSDTHVDATVTVS
jgi:hypothetical protein